MVGLKEKKNPLLLVHPFHHIALVVGEAPEVIGEVLFMMRVEHTLLGLEDFAHEVLHDQPCTKNTENTEFNRVATRQRTGKGRQT